MKIFFGKISGNFDTKQIDDGYYQAPKESTWYNGIDVGDYAFIIGGNRIQLWKARAWNKMTTNQNDKLEFDILISDTGLKIKDLIAFKFLKLTVSLIVKTTRSTGGEKKAFFELEMEPTFLETDLLNPEIYRNKDNFRNIRTVLPKQSIDFNSYDVQLQFKEGRLILHPIKNCEQGIIDKYIDNTSKIGKGQPLKDKTLSILRASKNILRPLDISIKDLYDACMCKYKVITQKTKYWVVNGYEQEKINYDLENDSFVMYFQYTVQKQGPVTQTLNTAKRIKPGDKVLLFNQNKFFGHSTFIETEVESTLETTLDDLLRNRSRNDDGEIVTFTDAPCIYEDLTVENGFNGEWGQRLSLEVWEDVHKSGINVPGIMDNLGPNSIITNTIIQLSDNSFFDLVKKILSGEVQNSKEYKKMNSIIDLLQYKKQIILQGPPGTGKTYSAKKMAFELLGGDIPDRCKLIQFHPSYTYEDFVRGIVSEIDEEGNIFYQTKNKIIAEFAETAAASEENHVLIIDEINRANLPSVLGELIYALEYRNEPVQSLYDIDGDNTIIIPDNLFIIGTMNTADRSVGHIDYAIKRRFAFVDVFPNVDVINTAKGKALFICVANLFVKVKDGININSDFLASDFNFKEIQLGHSYFLLKGTSTEEQKAELEMRLTYEIIPILNEYVKDGLLLETAKEEIKKIAEFEC
ncbi:McrB family protein [Flavobacterium sp. LC2016-12]|uniref:McrB family protein n=1 Tax=Flavobacterium sp. LC2016-12 TaxID=2783794 RepID=UPI001E3DDBDC|nr:AAA family ATPase [Flavobacterium sp. LC2016-12]